MQGRHQSVSSEVLDFYRAQGPPVRLELPLVQNYQEIIPYLNRNMDAESDYPIFQLARTLQLHQVFGPMPSAQMLLQEILQVSMMNHHDLYIQRPLNVGLIQFPLVQQYYRLLGKLPQPAQFQVFNSTQNDSGNESIQVDPFWGNNWEASSSSTPQVLGRLITMDEGMNENSET